MKYISSVLFIVGAFIVTLVIINLALHSRTKKLKKNAVDTVYVIKHDTVFIEKGKDPMDVPIPSFTKFKVSDFVCVDRNDVTGVVLSIRWSENSGAVNVLVYNVKLFRNLYDEDDDLEYDYDEFYESELNAGKCN